MNTNEQPEKAMTRREMRQAIGNDPITQSQMRYFVDLYYQLQEFRKAGANQEGAAKRAGK